MDIYTSEEKRNKLMLQFFDGHPITSLFPRKSFEQTLLFTPSPGDIFVSGYPKSGTTWLQYIVWDIIHNGVSLPIVNDIWTKEFAHLEMVGTDGLSSLAPPRLLKVNLAFQYVPFNDSAKYLYITRNPFDICASYYEFMKMLQKDSYGDASFDDFFNSFLKGDVSHGDYFDHVSSWYHHRKDPNFLFLTYEELKNDPKYYILKIAKFLNEAKYENLIRNPDILEKIFENTKFGKMKQSCPLYWDLTERGTFERKEQWTQDSLVQFFRKGTVGDWKVYFSENQRRLLQNKIKDKLKIEELISLWQELGFL